MKKTAVLLLILSIFIAGCVEESAEEDKQATISEEAKILQIVEAYLGTVDVYIEQNGRNLRVINIAQQECTGCWIIDLEYDYSYDSKEELRIELREWGIVDVASTAERMPLEQAVEIAENSDCRGKLITETAMYNNNTKTWWIDLELEKPGCNPACVIRESDNTAAINWRCTGLII